MNPIKSIAQKWPFKFSQHMVNSEHNSTRNILFKILVSVNKEMMKCCTDDKYLQLSLRNMQYVYITSPQMEQLHVNSLSYHKKGGFPLRIRKF